MDFAAMLHLEKKLPNIMHPFNPNNFWFSILSKQQYTPI